MIPAGRCINFGSDPFRALICPAKWTMTRSRTRCRTGFWEDRSWHRGEDTNSATGNERQNVFIRLTRFSETDWSSQIVSRPFGIEI